MNRHHDPNHCATCGKPITLTYFITVSGGTRVISLAGPTTHYSKPVYCRGCAEDRIRHFLVCNRPR